MSKRPLVLMSCMAALLAGCPQSSGKSGANSGPPGQGAAPAPVAPTPHKPSVPARAAAIHGLFDGGINNHGYREYQRECDGGVMVLVPAGEFPKRDFVPDPLAAQNQFLVDVPAFLIDKTEITNAQLEAYLSARSDLVVHDGIMLDGNGKELARSHPWGLDIGDSKWRVQPGFEKHPAICVSGALSLDFARWAGGDLPRAYEWEKAAASAFGDEYPFGEAGAPVSSNVVNNYMFGPRTTMLVNSLPQGASRYGILHMAGNVCERAYPCRRPEELVQGLQPLQIRGGSWASAHYAALRCSDQADAPMDLISSTVGIRPIIRDHAVLKRLESEKTLQLRVQDDMEKAFDEASKRNVPVLLILDIQTSAACDRMRVELLTDPVFAEWCNEHLVVLVGHDPGDGWQDPLPDDARGNSILYPGHKARKLQIVYEEFVVNPDRFVVPQSIWGVAGYPKIFLLNPHRDAMTDTGQLVLIGHDVLSPLGCDAKAFMPHLKRAQQMLGDAQPFESYTRGEPGPKTSWTASK